MHPLDIQNAAFLQGAGLLGGAANVASALGGVAGAGQSLQNTFYNRPTYNVSLSSEMQFDLDEYLKDWDK